jgi:hypothetical protein
VSELPVTRAMLLGVRDELRARIESTLDSLHLQSAA